MNKTKQIIFNKNIKKEIKAFLRDKNLKILEITYKGKRLNSSVLWPKLRNPLGMIIRGFIFDLLRRFPPCELKNHIFRLFGMKIGKDVTIAPYNYIDPLFPDLITIEDGALIGGSGAITAHEFFGNKIKIGKTIIKKQAQLGARAFIRSGISVGKYAQISVYSFVNKDIEDYEFVAGQPAKHINWIYPYGLKFDSIGGLLNNKTEENKDKIFLIDVTKNKQISYNKLNEEVNKLSNYLKKSGIKKEDVIAILLPNCNHYLLSYFAIQKIGAIAYLVNTKLKEDELIPLLNNSGTNYIITNNDFIKTIEKIKHKIENLHNIFNIENKDYNNNIKKQNNKFKVEHISPDDPSTLIYTSGTTGTSKGVLLTHKNLITNLEAVAERLNLGRDSIHLSMRPLFYVAGIFATILLPLYYGGTIVLYKKFSRTRFWKLIHKYKINFAELSTSMISILLNPPEDITKYNLISLKFIGVGGAPLHKEIVTKFENHFKVPLFECYGLTESSCLTTYTPPEIEKRKIGSPGIPLKTNKIKIVDEESTELKAGKVGEVLIRGPNIASEYYTKKEKKPKIFHNGWFDTGDLGYIDKDGYLYILGRKKELIKRGGENISPNEVDQIIYKHPKVKEACAVGVYDQILGEEVKAYVALKPKQKATEKEIIDFCKKHIAEYKCPKSIEFMKELPKSPTGKILRRELQEMDKNDRK